MKRFIVLSAVLLLSLTCLSAADVSGEWKFTSATPNGDPINATLKLKSDGSKVTGTIEAEIPGKVSIDDGTLEGENLVLKITVKNEEGGTVAYVMKGTVNGSEMKGTVEGEMDGEKIRMNWTARKV